MGSRAKNHLSGSPPSPTKSVFDSDINHSHSHSRMPFSSSSSTTLDLFSEQPVVLDDCSITVKHLENVTVIKEKDSKSPVNNNNNNIIIIEDGTIDQYPLRTSAEDCIIFLKTGKCNFGLNCKFNHSLRKAYQVLKEDEREGFLRPKTQIECKYYLTTGCKFGKSCRYIHSKEMPEISLQGLNPCDVSLELDLQDKDKEIEASVERALDIKCKYYLTTGGCRYGKDCRYKHSNEKAETNQPELNFLGLPIRVGEKECEFYMRTGACGYGVSCRFHHPDPVTAEVSEPFNSTCSGMSRRDHSLGNHNSESYNSLSKRSSVSSDKISVKTVPRFSNHQPHAPEMHSLREKIPLKPEWSCQWSSLADAASLSSDRISFKTVPRLGNQSSHPPGTHSISEQILLKPEQRQLLSIRSSVPDAASLSLDKLSIKTVPRSGNHSSNAPEVPSHQEHMHLKPEWSHLQEKTTNCNLSPLRNWGKTADISTKNLEQIQSEEYPERPDQPECSYFVATGNCKYKAACRFHHPKDQASNFPVCTLNSKGLPLRPDKRICRHYKQFGICKFGRGCLYDHPENCSSSTFQLDTFREP